MDRVVVRAPAKINLYLEVGGHRPDGYHDVDTVLQSLRIADVVEIRRAERLSLTCEPDLAVPACDNLGFRAAEALGRRLGRSPEVEITIHKTLPAGAGLGGGSADAAAVLVGMAALWGIDSNDPLMTAVAAEIGSDVPFFLVGGAALYTGRGDELVRSLPFVEMSLALVKPPEPVSTGQAYTTFDHLPVAPAPGLRALQQALEAGDSASVARAAFNNMTAAAMNVVPSVGEALSLCESQEGVVRAIVAGSGSAVCAFCESDAAARGVVAAAEGVGWWSVATKTSSDGASIVKGDLL